MDNLLQEGNTFEPLQRLKITLIQIYVEMLQFEGQETSTL